MLNTSGASEKLTVLVVDDDPSVREMAVDICKSLGCAVLDAYNGRDALRLLGAHPEIDMLLADVRMPGMTGTELASEARKVRPDLKIVLTSGYVENSPISGVPFVPKPFRVRDFAAVMQGGN